MLHYDYLIIGGGMTADAAVSTLAAGDPQGSIGLVSAESDPPYDRPPLTKGLWKDQELGSVWRETARAGATLHLDRWVKRLDVDQKQVVDDEGQVYAFGKLLLATGGRPRRLPFDENEEIIYYRTLADYRRVAELAKEKKRFAVIGGGFIGSELAAALAMNDNEVAMLFPEQAISALRFPQDLAGFLTEYYAEKGIAVHTGMRVTNLGKEGDEYILEGEDGREFRADVVVAGIGIQANTRLAEDAGLAVDDGIVVDRSLRTSATDIYAAGDVAAFYDPVLDKRRRVEHEDNALTMGKVAGQSMAGEPVRYDHSPFFYSDLFDLGYEAVGELDSQLQTVADWQDEFHKGVVYYLHDGRVRGVLLWNVWGQVDAARQLIADAEAFEPKDLKGRLPE
ncbi:MAG: FAD-dependent oxidoreductase [Anaerolineae bacterium]|jgi:NAD(P)H-nitrite reductase large subunit